MTSHSPAPWASTRGSVRIFDALGNPVCDLVSEGRIRPHLAEDQALLTAGPAMLAALISAESVLAEACEGQDQGNACWDALRQVRAAIAQAEGRP